MDDNQHKFYFQFRVRYAETDAQGIVFNGNYLTYKDTVLVGGKVVWVYVDQKLKTSSPLPENLVNMISSFEEGGA